VWRQEKQLFDSRSVARAVGLAKYCFCVLGSLHLFVFYLVLSYQFSFFSIGGNDLLYEKNAEVRVTCYHPKTTPKRA
jgi:hypothetical protein